MVWSRGIADMGDAAQALIHGCMPVYLRWMRLADGGWYDLFYLNLHQAHFDNLTGLYIVFRGNDLRNVVCMGNGLIREGLLAVRHNPAVFPLAFPQGLSVTWAQVNEPFILDWLKTHLSNLLLAKLPSAEYRRSALPETTSEA